MAKGDGATHQDRLIMAAIDLSAVAARSAPEPFGKAVKVVFDAAWSAVLEVGDSNMDWTRGDDVRG